jgi:aminomuconate-semialdehyde/2-hydroxymuconate-6-semialdehyde dehydrogenase
VHLGAKRKVNVKIRNLINNELLAAIEGRTLDNVEPATGKPYGTIPASSDQDVELAIVAAESAFPKWSTTAPEKRAALLNRLADLVEQNLDELAMIESRDNGKPVRLARTVDIPRAVTNLRFFASAATQFASESHSMPGTAINYTMRQPLGPVACISPWNLPLYLFTWKIAPALATGNTVVGKPSEVTPASAYLFSQLVIEAGFPPGVLNIVHGDGHGAGAPLVTDERIKAVSFTGGTHTGAWIAEALAPSFKKVSLELGGKNPTIVFADADYEQALAGSLRSAFSNQGQICLCGSRIYVQRDIYQRFRDDFVAATRKLVVGDPLEAATDQGALVSEAHMKKILRHIQIAHDEGGTLLAGGDQARPGGRCEDGFFITPTVFENLGLDCRTTQEEIFGPVVTLTPFDDESDALRHANGTQYGLAASVWSSKLDRCHRMANALEFGIVWINCWLLRDLRTPFGGMKASGLGREGGMEAMNFFTEAKNICIAIQDRE